MKAVGIVGYKNTGKTSLIIKIAEKLSEKYTVGIIKHAERFDEKRSDTQKFSEMYNTGYVSLKKSGIIFPEERSLEEMIAYLNIDILLVEGFKDNRSFPKITCGGYEDELAIASDEEDIDTIVEKIEEYGFKLANENCGRCGYDCEQMASMIVHGEATPEQCQQLSKTEIRVNGKKIQLNKFMGKLVRGVVHGIMDSLSGVEEGKIEITIEE
ncbi:MAG: molybdopterin-guanine dinucleotide biosynthesis protein MobB [Euryarchaeota archaeon]|nr:molybdopterin-guanine dinucleotide biosynthesis protein MobB [Euryarchaeota archaeon]